MRNNDEVLFKFFGGIENLEKKADSDHYKELLSYVKDRKSGLQGLLKHACQHQEELRELKNGQSRYYYDPYTYSVIRQPDNGQLALIIRKEDYLDFKKTSGGYKSGGNSLLIDHQGITPYFTLASFEKDSISNLKTELAVINKIKSPFIQRPLPGTEREIKKDQRRLSISAPRAKGDGRTVSFDSLEDFLLAVKCLALGLKDISDANYVHQDIKPENILVLPNGILQVIDFGLSTPQEKGKCRSSAGYVAPEMLVDITAAQREALVEICGDNEEYRVLLSNQESLPLKQQIENIIQVGASLRARTIYTFYYNFIENYQFNEKTILWCHRVGEDKGQKPGRLLPDPKQDVWSFGVTILELVENLPERLKNHDHIRALESLIEEKIQQPASSRIDTNTFIGKLNELLEKTGLAKKIQERIDEHIRVSTGLKTSDVALNPDRHYKAIAQELKQEGAIAKPARSSLFLDHDELRKKQVTDELKNILTGKELSSQQRQEKISSLIQRNIGLFGHGGLREIALRVPPEYREGLQSLSNKLGL